MGLSVMRAARYQARRRTSRLDWRKYRVRAGDGPPPSWRAKNEGANRGFRETGCRLHAFLWCVGHAYDFVLFRSTGDFLMLASLGLIGVSGDPCCLCCH